MITELGNQVDRPEFNKILYDDREQPLPDRLTVVFKGKGNVLYIENGATFADSVISFNGDNAAVYLSRCKWNEYRLSLELWRESSAYFGSNNYYNGPFHAILSERRNLIVGSDGIFSFGIWVRTADPHLIYDIESRSRINLSRSIVIGDHVWLGQNAIILKGSHIGSGSIIAADCVIAGKKVESNTIYAGNPARKIKDGVFFRGANCHNFSSDQTKESMKYDGDEFLYRNSGDHIDVETIDEALTIASNGEERIRLLQKNIASNTSKGRFSLDVKLDEKEETSFIKKLLSR